MSAEETRGARASRERVTRAPGDDGALVPGGDLVIVPIDATVIVPIDATVIVPIDATAIVPGDDTAIVPIDDAVLAALVRPDFYAVRGGGAGVGGARVEHVQTHISHVFLVGDDVYKLKKAVRFSFLDFGTRERRRFFCGEELRLNRRLAAPVYVGVSAVVRRADGTLALAADAIDDGAARSSENAVEAVVHMRRLPAEGLLPALLARDAVDADMMAALARRIAAFHGEAPTGPDVAAYASPAALARRFDDTLELLRRFVGDVVQADDHATLVELAAWYVAAHAELLVARQAAGRIREGHGDLHAEHVCFVGEARGTECEEHAGVSAGDAAVRTEDSPADRSDPAPARTERPGPLPPGIYVFDCIEFSRPFRCNDVASEIAFLTMDLEARGRRDLADAFAAAYVAAADDPQIPALVPYYATFRACVRAMVAAVTSAEVEVDAGERAEARRRSEHYVALALRSGWRLGAPMLIACCGLSGTGKSTLAAALAEPTDGVVVRTDVLRKRGAAAAADTRAARYSPAARAAIYAELAAEVARHLASGRTVIADATFLRRADRDAVAAVAARHGRRAVFVETVAGPDVVRARLAARTAADVSDARFDTYLAQREAAEPWGGDEPHLVVASDDGPAAVRARALRALFAWRRANVT